MHCSFCTLGYCLFSAFVVALIKEKLFYCVRCSPCWFCVCTPLLQQAWLGSVAAAASRWFPQILLGEDCSKGSARFGREVQQWHPGIPELPALPKEIAPHCCSDPHCLEKIILSQHSVRWLWIKENLSEHLKGKKLLLSRFFTIMHIFCFKSYFKGKRIHIA